MTDAAESTEIVVGVDDSPSSQAALEWAARDAKLRQAALVVVYAATLPMGTWPIAPVPTGNAPGPSWKPVPRFILVLVSRSLLKVQ